MEVFRIWADWQMLGEHVLQPFRPHSHGNGCVFCHCNRLPSIPVANPLPHPPPLRIRPHYRGLHHQPLIDYLKEYFDAVPWDQQTLQKGAFVLNVGHMIPSKAWTHVTTWLNITESWPDDQPRLPIQHNHRGSHKGLLETNGQIRLANAYAVSESDLLHKLQTMGTRPTLAQLFDVWETNAEETVYFMLGCV